MMLLLIVFLLLLLLLLEVTLLWCIRCSSLPKLNVLDLGIMIDMNLDVLEILCQRCPKVTHFNLEDGHGISLEWLHTLVERWPNLETLRLDSGGYFSEIGDRTMEICLPKLKRLRRVDLIGIDSTDRTVQALINSENEPEKRLAKVRLNGENMTDLSVILLSRCRNLTELRIHLAMPLTNACLPYLKELSNLRQLQIYDNDNFTGNGICQLFKPGNFPKLLHLEMTWTSQLNDQCVEAITKW